MFHRPTVIAAVIAALCAGTANAATFDPSRPAVGPAKAVQTAPATYDSRAPFAFMMDAESGAVLFARSADERMPPSSMGKLMTTHVVFEMLKRGEIKLSDTVRVTADTWRAWNNRGSTMFLEVDEEVSIEDLLHGVVTLSGNDACVVLAEGLMGTEAAFVARMNQSAMQLGMKNSRFANTTGWPDPQEYVTPRDLALLARATVTSFPDLYKRFYATPDYTRRLSSGKTIYQPNRNPILGLVKGADGLKTGHTEAAGYGFTGSAVQNGTRLIMVVNGLTSEAERSAESGSFLNWGFRAFERKALVSAGQVVEQAPVWLGSAQTVPLVATRAVSTLVPRGSPAPVKPKLVYKGPIPAPVKAGQIVGHIELAQPGGGVLRVPVKAGADVGKAGVFGRIAAGFTSLFQ